MSDERRPWTGGCLCGGVRYEIRGRLGAITLCHCSQCRRFHGGAAPYASARREKLSFTSERSLAWFQSSPLVKRGFCRECGSSLFWSHEDLPLIEIAMGTVDGATGMHTTAHIWTDSRADWENLDDGLPRHPKDPPRHE